MYSKLLKPRGPINPKFSAPERRGAAYMTAGIVLVTATIGIPLAIIVWRRWLSKTQAGAWLKSLAGWGSDDPPSPGGPWTGGYS